MIFAVDFVINVFRTVTASIVYIGGNGDGGGWVTQSAAPAVAEWVRASTGDRTIDGSTPTAGDFEFGTLAIPLTLLCFAAKFASDTVFRMRH